MAYRATRIDKNPIEYFLEHPEGRTELQVADVLLRENKDPKKVFAHLIRMATASKWSHSALLYLISDPQQGFDNTFLVQAMTQGIDLVSWRNEVIPFEHFTVGIKRPKLDWYVETPHEQARHTPHDPEDTHAIGYRRHVRGIALDTVNGLYDHKVIYELTALYTARAARRHLSAVPQLAQAADAVADFFKHWNTEDDSYSSVLHFICSGLVQYSFFEALRRRIINDMAIPEHRDAAMSNLSNMQRILFRDDPRGIMPGYIEQVQSGRLDIRNSPPEDVLDLLKTAVPADFNNSPNLEWRYVILNGVIWRIEEAPESYAAQSKDEEDVLEMVRSEHFSKEDEQ